MYAREYPDYITITCLKWKHLLADDMFKDVILDSLRFLTRIRVFAFVIMSNHFHMIWQMRGEHKREDVQRDFLKYTSQQILKHLRNTRSPWLNQSFVGAKDRKYQVWERNALSVPLYSDKVFFQKLEYIHNNPVRADLCKYPDEYKYSSAAFYHKNRIDFDFLTHYDG